MNFVTHFSEDSFHHVDGPGEENADGTRRGPKRHFADIDTRNIGGKTVVEDDEEENKAGPNILELQSAIAAAAKTSGKPRPRFTHKLPRNHPDKLLLEDTISQRSLEHNHFARYLMNRAVYRLRRRIRTLEGIAQAEYFLTNPRAPRPKKRGQQTIRGLCSGAPGDEISFDPKEKRRTLDAVLRHFVQGGRVPSRPTSLGPSGGSFQQEGPGGNAAG